MNRPKFESTYVSRSGKNLMFLNYVRKLKEKGVAVLFEEENINKTILQGA